MNNFFPKNIKATLTPIEETLLTHDEDTIETVILGGWVSNISNKDQPSLAGTTDYFTLQIYNIETEETINLYKDIPIRSNTTFPINKIHFNHYNQLKVFSTYSNNLQITLSYFEVVNYDYGIVKVNFQPDNLLALLPTWYFIDTEEEYLNGEYIPINKGLQNIEFQTIFGWERPDSIAVNIKQLKTTEITATYILIDSIISFYNNQINLIDSFQWKLVDSDIWVNNLETMILPVGEYEFEFKEIDTYYKPNNVVISTQEKTNYTQKITYNKIQEYVTVNLTPPFVKLGITFIVYNRWRVVYPSLSYSPWYNSGDEILFNINNDYTLEIESNDYYTPTQNNLSFNLEEGIPVAYNITMQAV